MELGKLKRFEAVWVFAGWLSVLLGICSLLFINFGILKSFQFEVDGLYTSIIQLTFLFGIVAVFSKASRALGLWGLGIGLFMTVITAAIFILGWMVSPFP